MGDLRATFSIPAAAADLRDLVTIPERVGAALAAADVEQALALARAVSGRTRAGLRLLGRAPEGDLAPPQGESDAPDVFTLDDGARALRVPLRVALSPDGGGLARVFGVLAVGPLEVDDALDPAAVGEALAVHVATLLVERALARRGGVDRLTGLLARPAFERGLPALTERIGRGEPTAVALLDLDNLRAINAAGGPAAGDEVLAAVGAAAAAVAGAPERACRWGGDEVALVLPGLDAARATAALARVSEALSAASTPGGTASFSAGVACAPAHARDAEALLFHADQALAHAKREGPGRVVVWDEALRGSRGRDRVAGVLTGAAGRDYRNVQALLESMSTVSRLAPLEETLGALLERVVDVTGAERGLVILADGDGWRAAASQGRRGAEPPSGSGFATTAVEAAVEAGRAVHLLAEAADAPPISPSAERLGLRAVLCAPLLGEDVPRGAVYVDSRDPRRFDAPTLAFFDALVAAMATALRNASLYDRLRGRAERLAADVAGREAELARVRRRLEKARPPEPARGDAYAGIVGASPSMQELFTTLRSLEGTGVPVVIEGESGTGKELVARAIHARSPRAAGPLVAVNCGAIPEALVESELFGHLKGAFTGAHADRAGLIEVADGGTLFLDELGELPLDAQAKLLRVLESGEVRRVGAGDVKTVDVRVVAATNRDLKRAIAEGGFREDLFYRLAVFRLRLPPLRERPQDVPRLVAHALSTLGRSDAVIEPEAMRILVSRRWPGNVRELKNVLERALALAGGDPINAGHVTPDEPEAGGPGSDDDLYDMPMQDARALFSLRYARRAIDRADGSVPEAARRSGVSRQTFYRAIADGQRVAEGGAASDLQE